MSDEWEMNADSWDDEYKSNPEIVIVADRILEIETAGLTPGTALDLGCGSGPNAIKLAEKGWSVVGIDWSDQAIALARAEAARKNVDATFLVADTTIWEPTTQFDLVITTYALPGGDDSRKVLNTAVKALASGGTLIVAEWDKSMADVWGFSEDDLMTPGEIAACLPGLDIDKAVVLEYDDIFSLPDDPRGKPGDKARVALVRAHKP